MRSLIPWRSGRGELTPPRAMLDFRREFSDLFHRFFGGELPAEGYFEGTFLPALDVSESDTAISVSAELPGIKPEDIEVRVSGNVLTVKGEKREDREEKGDKVHRIERSFGSFVRSVALPSEVQEDEVEAKFKDGVLKITLPKSETSKGRMVSVQAE